MTLTNATPEATRSGESSSPAEDSRPPELRPLQSRILDLLATRALAPRSLYWLLRGHSYEAVDAALRVLRESKQVTLAAGHFRRFGAPVAATPAEPPPEHAKERKKAALGDRLTLREAEVADLIATMRPMPALAQELGITVKALYGHLGRLYAKLGVRRREELAAAVGKREGVTERTALIPAVSIRESGADERPE